MKTFLLLFASLCVVSAVAQNIPLDVKWGKEFKASKKSTLDDVIGYDETGFYVLKKRYGTFVNTMSLEHFDQNMNATHSEDIELRDGHMLREFELVAYFNDKLWLFSTYADPKSRVNYLYLQEVNKRTLLPHNDKRVVAEVDFEGKWRSNSGGFNIRISRDESKLLVYYAMPYTAKEPKKFGFHVLDLNLTELWHNEITLPYTDELFDVKSLRVDDHGDVYLLGLLFKDVRKSKRKGAPNYEYKVLSYTERGDSANEYSVSLQDKFLTDMQIDILDNKTIVCAGFYSEEGKVSIRGTYFISIDARSKEINNKSFKEFGIDFLTQTMGEGKAKRTARKEARGGDVELYDYDLDNLVLRDDGGAILIAEQYFAKTVTYTKSFSNGVSSTHTSTSYYYNDIIVVSIDPAGRIEWAMKIPKRQVSQNGGFYLSYAMAVVHDRLYFVFNDNRKNIDYSGKGKPSIYIPGTDALVTIVEVNSEGKVRSQPVFSSIGLDVIVRPQISEQISENELILFGQRKKKQQFAKVSFR